MGSSPSNFEIALIPEIPCAAGSRWVEQGPRSRSHRLHHVLTLATASVTVRFSTNSHAASTTTLRFLTGATKSIAAEDTGRDREEFGQLRCTVAPRSSH
jgi:hypothetical protein